MEHNKRSGDFRAHAVEEFKLYWLIVLYLWIFLGSFTIYRRLVVAETGAAYLNYGIALIEALVIAKVIVVGSMLNVSRRFEDKPLLIPVLYKSILFGALVLLFGIVEHIVKGWFHSEGLLGGIHTIGELGAYELGARVLVLMVALVPFFAFWELGRILGKQRLSAMFLSKGGPPTL